MRQRIAAGDQHLERVVDAGGVRLAVRDQRPHLVEVGADQRRTPSTAARAYIQLTLPRTVLISPLWARKRYGCASCQDGKVLVEKR